MFSRQFPLSGGAPHLFYPAPAAPPANIWLIRDPSSEWWTLELELLFFCRIIFHLSDNSVLYPSHPHTIGRSSSQIFTFFFCKPSLTSLLSSLAEVWFKFIPRKYWMFLSEFWPSEYFADPVTFYSNHCQIFQELAENCWDRFKLSFSIYKKQHSLV